MEKEERKKRKKSIIILSLLSACEEVAYLVAPCSGDNSSNKIRQAVKGKNNLLQSLQEAKRLRLKYCFTKRQADGGETYIL